MRRSPYVAFRNMAPGPEYFSLLAEVSASGVVSTVSTTPSADPSGTVAGFADATGNFLPLAVTLNAARGARDAVADVQGLRRGVLPVSRRSQDLVRDILPVTKVGDAVIRAKTGLLGAEIGKPSLGWVVGWAEKGNMQTVFALNVDCKEPRHIAARMTLAQQCLTDIGSI